MGKGSGAPINRLKKTPSTAEVIGRYRKPKNQVTADGRHNLMAQSLNLGYHPISFHRPRTQMNYLRKPKKEGTDANEIE